jgi:ankyrin repeat protein
MRSDAARLTGRKVMTGTRSITLLLTLLVPLTACSVNLDENLLRAASEGKAKKVQSLLEAGADVNAKNDTDMTALMLAAGSGHTEIVQNLLDAGAKLNVKDMVGKTALMRATQNGHTDIVTSETSSGRRDRRWRVRGHCCWNARPYA